MPCRTARLAWMAAPCAAPNAATAGSRTVRWRPGSLLRRRRNPAKLWMIGAILFAVAALGGIGAVAWYGLPDWVPLASGTFARGEPNLVLDFPPNRQDRRTLPNGAEFFGASGSITNVGKVRLSVPLVLITLRDARDRIVYSWEVVPSKRELAPGESVTINEAVTDVPKS